MTSTLSRLARLGLCSSFFALVACGSEEEKGTVSITAYGESFVEDGIPAEDVVDGWAIDFSRFEVRLSDVSIGGVKLDGVTTTDLAKSSEGKGHTLGSVSVPSGQYSDAAFTISQLDVVGTATKDATTKSFNWRFEQPVRYDECETTVDVADGLSATFEITVHADHFLVDSHAHDEPELRFQALADADTDVDGEITQAELAARDIGTYDPGSAGGVDDLWAWLTVLSQRVGHVDGEGHCRASPVK